MQHIGFGIASFGAREVMKSWRESEFEIVNTTFLSDLDY